MKTLLLALGLLLLGPIGPVQAETHIDMDIIAQIESSGNPGAISYRGAKYGRGLCQISEICLADYNAHVIEGELFYLEDLFDAIVNLHIADWYMNKRIPAMLQYFGIEDNTTNRLWAYNAGIGRARDGVMPEETKKYIEKYFRLLDK